eukprot:CAMPEP_0174706406 /NCGR_PEP_ID=MMETSP1094-20130205/9266_1 /TAXON_ID=156173 /ORGANISM="Chrysochromulina brevifilum, Strain UTEX LB 985" /LENGTH=133 /DNA_ID=CAMNT_0015904663 /DNA_START=117 /DNA_END=513 /DNA_ORIENTATION=-
MASILRLHSQVDLILKFHSQKFHSQKFHSQRILKGAMGGEMSDLGLSHDLAPISPPPPHDLPMISPRGGGSIRRDCRRLLVTLLCELPSRRSTPRGSSRPSRSVRSQQRRATCLEARQASTVMRRVRECAGAR